MYVYMYVNVSTMIRPILKKWQQFTHADSLELNTCNISLTVNEQRTILDGAKMHFSHLSISVRSHKILYLHARNLEHSQHTSQHFLSFS